MNDDEEYMRRVEEYERRFAWGACDTVAQIIFVAVSIGAFIKGDLVMGAALLFAYPVVRALAISATMSDEHKRQAREWRD